jgi:hypothetical protein
LVQCQADIVALFLAKSLRISRPIIAPNWRSRSSSGVTLRLPVPVGAARSRSRRGWYYAGTRSDRQSKRSDLLAWAAAFGAEQSLVHGPSELSNMDRNHNVSTILLAAVGRLELVTVFSKTLFRRVRLE